MKWGLAFGSSVGTEPDTAIELCRVAESVGFESVWGGEHVIMPDVIASKYPYTVDGKNIVILQDFKEYFALGFFQGALLKDAKKLLVQLGQVQAGRVMKFTNVAEIIAKAATIKTYVREAMAVEKAGLRVTPKKTADFPVPEELTARFKKDPRFKRAFDALTPGRQRGYLYHFAGAKQAATREARITKAMPAIFAGRGFLERR